MHIRLAEERDVLSIRVLLERNYDEIMSEHHSKRIIDKFKSRTNDESISNGLKWKRVYVVEDGNGEIIATGAFANFGSAEKPKYSISNLFVMPEKQSSGIGRILFEKLYQEAKANHANSFHVPSSKNAIRFYEKMGFMIDVEQPEKDDEVTWMTTVL